MASTTHGDIKEITFNHPDLGSGRFRPKSGEGNTYKLGGFQNSDDANGISTDGTLVMTKNRVSGSLEAVCINNTAAGEISDAGVLQQLMDSAKPADWTFTTMADAVYSGNGHPVGEVVPDLNAGTFTLKIAVPLWRKIA